MSTLKEIYYYCYFFLLNRVDIDLETQRIGVKDLVNSGSEYFTKWKNFVKIFTSELNGFIK